MNIYGRKYKEWLDVIRIKIFLELSVSRPGSVVTLDTDVPLELDQFGSPHDKNICYLNICFSFLFCHVHVGLPDSRRVQHVFLRIFSLAFVCSSRGTLPVRSFICISVVCKITGISCYAISCMSELEPSVSYVQVSPLAGCFRLLPVVMLYS
jgi:hypothetical protein